VTSSRLHAVRYKQAIDKYLAEHDYGDIHAVVAFSGKVVPAGEDPYTEANMNDFPESQTGARFKGAAIRAAASVSTFGSRPVRAAFLECSAAALQFIEAANDAATAPDDRRAALERMQRSVSLLNDLMNDELPI
jgi:hypothetical protein